MKNITWRARSLSWLLILSSAGALASGCAEGANPGQNAGFTQAGTDPNDPEGGAGANGESTIEGGADGSGASGAEGGTSSNLDGGATLPEGGGTAAVPCGTSLCRADETCTGSECQLASACVGPTVPGDYATISAAITALANTGNDVFICLTAQTYTSSGFSITDPGNHLKNFHITGVSEDATTIQGTVTLGTGFANASITGVTIDGQTTTGLSMGTTNTNLNVTASRIRGSQAVYLYGAQVATLTFDGVDVSPSTASGSGFYVAASSVPNSAQFTLKNSYIHDASYCAEISQMGTSMLANNTFLNCSTALYTVGSGINFGYYNNIIAKSQGTAVNIQSGVIVAHGNNALWGNTTNYGGLAVAGTGYVTTDCMLDNHAPPGLSAGSPCLGTGDTTHAPSVDYYDVARTGKVDIGAVQSP